MGVDASFGSFIVVHTFCFAYSDEVERALNLLRRANLNRTICLSTYSHEEEWFIFKQTRVNDGAVLDIVQDRDSYAEVGVSISPFSYKPNFEADLSR